MTKPDLLKQRVEAQRARDEAESAHAQAVLDVAGSPAWKEVVSKLNALHDPNTPDAGVDDAVRATLHVLNQLESVAQSNRDDAQRRLRPA